MAGVMQSEFSLPSVQCGRFLSELKEAGLIDALPATLADSEFIHPISYSKRELNAPFLSFWSYSGTGSNRRIDLHWIVGQDEVAEKIEEAIKRSGGITTYKSK